MSLKEKIEHIGLERAARTLSITTDELERKVVDLDFTVQEVFGIKALLGLKNEEACKLFCI